MHLMISLIKQTDSINFGLTTNLLCIIDICWVSTAVVLANSAHTKISFRTWLFQMFFSKGLIKCEKFASCLMQYSKKCGKWPETCVLILNSYWNPQFLNFAIPPILLSHSITQRYSYPCTAFSLHNFKLLLTC